MAAQSRSTGAGKGVIIALMLGLAAVWTSPAAAEPPDWAPAHGYRAKHKNKTKYKHDHDYEPYASRVAPIDIRLGQCDRDLVGGILGAAAGAAVGSQVVDKDDRAVGIIGGAIIGVIVGGALGHLMDEADQGCIGHTLENVPDGQTITWNDPERRRTYRVTPETSYRATNGQICREYVTEAVIGGRIQEVVGTACRQPDGAWKLVS